MNNFTKRMQDLMGEDTAAILEQIVWQNSPGALYRTVEVEIVHPPSKPKPKPKYRNKKDFTPEFIELGEKLARAIEMAEIKNTTVVALAAELKSLIKLANARR